MKKIALIVPLLIANFAFPQLGFAAPGAGEGGASNKEICEKAYKDSPVEKFVCEKLGESHREYRDCLIESRERGQGFVERHVRCFADRK